MSPRPNRYEFIMHWQHYVQGVGSEKTCVLLKTFLSLLLAIVGL